VCIGITVLGVLEIVERGKADTSALGSNRISNGLDDFHWEPASVLYRTTVLVSTGVDVIMKKLLEKVAICACAKCQSRKTQTIQRASLTMDLNAVKSSLNGSLCGGGELSRGSVDLVHRHGPGRVLSTVRAV
jgi:hypothetical protein